MHLPPEVWGPIFWSTLHIIALAYPDAPSYTEKKAAKDLYTALTHLLPCPVCRQHYTEILKAMPVDTWLDSRTSLTKWVLNVHNEVNKQLKKPEITMSEFMAKYKQMAAVGLPHPPSGATAEMAEAAINAAFAQGVLYTILGIGAASLVGGLLWSSYK
jgi:FAD-linked sulfhydryl oxidase